MIRPISAVIALAILATTSAAIAQSNSAHGPNHHLQLPARYFGHYCKIGSEAVDAEGNGSGPQTYKRGKNCGDYGYEIEISRSGILFDNEFGCVFLKIDSNFTYGKIRVRMRCQETPEGEVTISDSWIFPSDGDRGNRPPRSITIEDIDHSKGSDGWGPLPTPQVTPVPKWVEPATTATSQPPAPMPEPGEPDLGLWNRLSK